MKFLITYKNGKKEIVSTSHETVEAQINASFGLSVEDAKEFGVTVVEAPADAELGLIPDEPTDFERQVESSEVINPEGGSIDKKLPPADSAATHNATTTQGISDGGLVETSPDAGEENSLTAKPAVAVLTAADGHPVVNPFAKVQPDHTKMDLTADSAIPASPVGLTPDHKVMTLGEKRVLANSLGLPLDTDEQPQSKIATDLPFQDTIPQDKSQD